MRKRSIYTSKLGKAVARAAKGSPRYHVIASLSGSWMVVAEGNVRGRSFATQGLASAFAQKHALEKRVNEVIIHEENGRVKDRITI